MTTHPQPDASGSLSDFEFQLPDGLIARQPIPNRDDSRLMVVSRKSGEIVHAQFKDLAQFLPPQTLMVFNNTKVMKARLFAHRKTGGKIEILLLNPNEDGSWEALVSPARALKVGEKLFLSDNSEVGFLSKGKDSEFARIRFESPDAIDEILDRNGIIPLPPYMNLDPLEMNHYEAQYQTVWASQLGAVAAPTAGLHFTEAILDDLKNKGFGRQEVTLHVGYGTFSPIKTKDLSRHQMHTERYNVSGSAATAISEAKDTKIPILGVGTTVVRTLESAWAQGCKPGSGETRLFITPGYQFQAIDLMLTNFHLPKSTLLVLVSAFAGTDLIRRAYQEAILEKYRFYSFGDAMLILP